jgi:hydroxymethylpyrimidine pyrophosphatase-like HAD family hydrolase
LQASKEHYRKKQYKGLFVVDLDGTLLTSERQFAREDLRSLARLQEMGYLIAVATGRSNYSFSQLMTTLGDSDLQNLLPFDYVIFSTGAGIVDFPGNTLLKSFSLSPGDVRHIVLYLETAGLDYMIHKPVPDTRHFVYSTQAKDNPDFHRRLGMYCQFASPLSWEILDSFGGATEVLCIVPEVRGHGVAAEIAGSLSQYSVIKATSPLDGESIWVEIFPSAVSKSQMVKWLAGQVGLQQADICAVGNDYNDEDLLRWAGKGFIVANGPQALKSIFHGVASNDAGGVGEAVAHWLSGRQ